MVTTKATNSKTKKVKTPEDVKAKEERAKKRKQNKDFQLLGTNYVNNPTAENYTALYNALKKPLTAFIYGFVKDSDQADMVFSEVMTKLITKSDYFRHGRFSTWIYTVARNAALTHMYHRDKWNYAGVDVSDFYDTSLPDWFNDDHKAEAYETVNYIDIANNIDIDTTKSDIANELSSMILNLISHLDNKLQADVMITKLTQKITFQELADKLDLSIQEVRRYYYDGQKKIRATVASDSKLSLMKDLYYGVV